MSSSDKFPDWSVFSKRPVPFDVELLSPASEMAVLLQKYLTDMNNMQKEIESFHNEGVDAAAQQAVYATQLASALDMYESLITETPLKRVHRHLRIIKDQMLSALENTGFKIDNPIGKPFDDIADRVYVDGWRHQVDFTSEVVAEVIEPIVIYRGKLVRRGRVVMGAPQEKAEDLTMADNVEET
jgi:hypothetical protein